MTVTRQPQIAIDETTIEDTARGRARGARAGKVATSKARKTFKEVDDDAKARIRQLELGSASVRVGRFVIAERELAGRSVAFDTEPTTRVTIRLAKDEF